jgi:hypothetical protein
MTFAGDIVPFTLAVVKRTRLYLPNRPCSSQA